jgi:membrane associated rhomboid family serine protease
MKTKPLIVIILFLICSIMFFISFSNDLKKCWIDNSDTLLCGDFGIAWAKLLFGVICAVMIIAIIYNLSGENNENQNTKSDNSK